VRRTLVKIGLRQARRHPRMALKVTASAARHPRRTRKLLRIARAGGAVPLAAAADKRVLIDAFASMRAVSASYRRAAVKARRRARLRKIAVGASVVGVAAYAERSRRAAA
jgi:hypothetical protein